MKARRVKVLFVCIGNSCRSPMAEAVARQDAGDTIEAFSAGLAPLGFVAAMTKQTLMKNGYAIDGLESKPIAQGVWEQADIVINMSGRARELTFREYAKVEDWEIADPYGDLEAYASAFATIRRRVADLAARLAASVPPRQTYGAKSAQPEKWAKGGSQGESV